MAIKLNDNLNSVEKDDFLNNNNDNIFFDKSNSKYKMKIGKKKS